MADNKKLSEIPEQTPVSWAIAFAVSWAGLKRRFLRSLITMAGVILAIAFLSYMLVTDSITKTLVETYFNNQSQGADLLRRLHQAGVDIFSAGEQDEMMIMLIGLSLLICLVGIINSMLMAVTERVKEIGTLKCLGAMDSFIVKSFFIESSMQGVMGTVIGIILGLLVAVAVAVSNFRGHAMVNFPVLGVAKSLVFALFTGSIISILAAIGPAYVAARKEPVEAMRVEE